jgi:hypothetical protein
MYKYTIRHFLVELALIALALYVSACMTIIGFAIFDLRGVAMLAFGLMGVFVGIAPYLFWSTKRRLYFQKAPSFGRVRFHRRGSQSMGFHA